MLWTAAELYITCSVTVAVTSVYCDWHDERPRVDWDEFLFMCLFGGLALLVEILFNWQPWKTPWR